MIVSETEVLKAEDGGQFAVTRVRRSEAPSQRTPVVLLPGLFSDRQFWLSEKGIGFAAYLAERGYICWLVERRGIGSAPWPVQGCIRGGLEELQRYDLPCLQRHLLQCECTPAIWIGHSFGGVSLARAAALSLSQAHIAGLILLAAQCESGLRSLRPPTSLLMKATARLLRQFPARSLGLGPADELPEVIEDACDWTTAAQRTRNFLEPLQQIKVPVLSLVGAGDRSDPPEGCRRFTEHFGSRDKEFSILGQHTGFAEDFSHAGLVISKAAQRQVWPLIADWMASRALQKRTHEANGSASRHQLEQVGCYQGEG